MTGDWRWQLIQDFNDDACRLQMQTQVQVVQVQVQMAGRRRKEALRVIVYLGMYCANVRNDGQATKRCNAARTRKPWRPNVR